MNEEQFWRWIAGDEHLVPYPGPAPIPGVMDGEHRFYAWWLIANDLDHAIAYRREE